ncbi:MAG TPA: DUF2330 domain-containing protein [Acidimicrobiales bacterium]|nr:DUF2330 domain-containing protein [Acidimicrobiales bacterium]
MRLNVSRVAAVIAASGLAVITAAAPAGACAGLFAPGADIKLLRTATLAAYHDGIEHYITSFSFSGGGAEVGSIIPLPDIPTTVERGGDWTLQRLERETQPQFEGAALAAADSSSQRSAEVILETRIDALDLTVLKGGAQEVGKWARDNGFSLTPDAPAVLEHYAARSPIFMAARFDTKAAEERGQDIGEGTPVHLTIPTERPWVPLRILGLGKKPGEVVEADVYMLTDERPNLVTTPVASDQGLFRQFDSAASDSLLNDLRADKGMEWIPTSMWLTYMRVAADAGTLGYDLTIPAPPRAESLPVETIPETKPVETVLPALVEEPEFDLAGRRLVINEVDAASNVGPLVAGTAGALVVGVGLAAIVARRRLFG